MCDDVLASNDIKVVGLPDTDVYARCVTADDAEAYASWLTARTRKRYRLPTAVEWEYAMRTIGAPVLSSGIVAEIVADCWQDLLPRSGREIIASQSGASTGSRERQPRMMRSGTGPARVGCCRIAPR